MNLFNAQHLRNTELVAALLTLGEKDKKREFDWSEHPWVQNAMYWLEKNIGILKHKNLLQTVLIMDRFGWKD